MLLVIGFRSSVRGYFHSDIKGYFQTSEALRLHLENKGEPLDAKHIKKDTQWKKYKKWVKEGEPEEHSKEKNLATQKTNNRTNKNSDRSTPKAKSLKQPTSQRQDKQNTPKVVTVTPQRRA